MGGIRFLRLLVTLNNDLDVYLIGRRTNGGSLIFVTDGDELRQDLTLRLGFGSIAFASSAER
jgi:hypothetical protein